MTIKKRACVASFALPFAVAAAASCDDGREISHEATGARASRAQYLPWSPATCDSEPWFSDNPRWCGSPYVVAGQHVTCDWLGVPAGGTTVMITEFQSVSAFTGHLSAQFSVENGFTSSVYTNTGFLRPELNDWGFQTNAKPDGSTMTVDAIIFWGASVNQGSVVYRFDPPEFYIRDMSEGFITETILLCGYRPGQAGGLPPPPDPPPPPEPGTDAGTSDAGSPGKTW
jgi:hypothetical protein